MSKSIMYDLYFGNLTPWDRGCPQASVYMSLARKVGDLKNHFKEVLSSEEYEEFEKLEDLQTQAGTIEDADLFEYGFCMATLIMIDVFNFKDTHLTDQKSK